MAILVQLAILELNRAVSLFILQMGTIFAVLYELVPFWNNLMTSEHYTQHRIEACLRLGPMSLKLNIFFNS